VDAKAPGRPKKPPSEIKKPIEVGVTDGERERLAEAAKAESLSLSAFVRLAALRAAQVVLGSQ
jgi:uncharacterized protein (DUF1778 family)